MIFPCAGYVAVSEVISSRAHRLLSPSRESQSVRELRQEGLTEGKRVEGEMEEKKFDILDGCHDS